MKDLLVVYAAGSDGRDPATRQMIEDDLAARLGIEKRMILVVPDTWKVEVLREVAPDSAKRKQ